MEVWDNRPCDLCKNEYDNISPQKVIRFLVKGESVHVCEHHLENMFLVRKGLMR